MKTARWLVALLVVFSLGLTACSGTKPAETQPAATDTKPAAPKEISFWAYEPDNQQGHDALTKLVNDFNAARKEIKVTLVLVPKGDYNTKLNAAVASSAAPDVAYLDQPLVTKFAQDGVLLQLDQYAGGSDGIKKEEYFQGALETNMLDGKLYGLPVGQIAVTLFYNKELVKDPPKTMDDLLKVAKDVYKPGKVAAFEGPHGGGWGAWLFPALAGSYGCKMAADDNKSVTFNSEGCLEAAKMMVELRKYSEKAVYESANAFQAGKVAMKISGPWEMAGFKANFPNLKYGVALIPAHKTTASNIGGDDAVIFKATKAPEAAWAFLKYLTSDDNAMNMFTITGNFPAKVKAAQDAKFQGDPDLKVFMEQLKTAQARPRITEWLKINDEILGKALDDILDGKEIKKTFDDAAAKANALIKK